MKSDLLSTRIKPLSRALPWLLPAALILVLTLVVGVGPSSLRGADRAVEVVSEPRNASTAVVTPKTGNKVVDWDQAPVESDPPGLSVAAYGN